MAEIVSCRVGDDGKQVYELKLGLWSGEKKYADFLRLSHARKRQMQPDKQRQEGLPKKPLNVLAAAAPWSKNGEGWRPELSASVRRVETWLGSNLDPEVKNFLSSEPTHSDESSASEVAEKVLAADLQQYFCLRANLDALMNDAFNGLPPGRRVNAIEPSCGDGRILAHLVRLRSEGVIPLDQVAGVELDPSMAAVSSAALGDEATVVCSDFLTTSIADLAPIGNSGAGIVVVGGPPYTDYSAQSSAPAKAEDNDAESSTIRGSAEVAYKARAAREAESAPASQFRTLPLRFVLHAATPAASGGLGAHRVCYLLPQRCSKASFAAQVLEGLGRFTWNGLSSIEAWEIDSRPCPEKNFSFRGRLVPQPSVIWTMTQTHLEAVFSVMPEGAPNK